MEIRHLSHDHPLVLIKEVLPEGDDDDGKFICHGCQELLSTLEPAYVCGQCKYFLHKVCAVLAREITHPKHDQHSLILLHRSPFDSGKYRCQVCLLVKKGFVYYCSLCEFGTCIPCAPKVNNDVLCASFKEEQHMIRHDGHEHSLIRQPKSALFHCDACDVEDKDMSYTCPSCPFWIHESCASLPSSTKRKDHDHTLSLAYGLPSDYTKYFLECEICRKGILPAYWVYFCGLCTYFVHPRCITQQNEANSDAQHDDDANFKVDDVLYLPATDISKELIGHFLVEKNHQLNQIQPDDQINHFNHKQHPLILFHEQKDNDDDDDDVEDDEILCNACITPISAPYYCCAECSYFLHQACANLPGKLQHPSHSHLLTIRCYQKFHSIFTCNICDWSSNGLFFKCERCNFFLDVKCAAFPFAAPVKHTSHKHPLFQCEASNKTCNACGYQCSGPTFGCLSCKFYLDYDCAMLPPAIKHRWDPHPLPLRFPPFSDLPVDFDCDICKKEMHPKRWIYHCSQCELTFHPNCVPRLRKYRNIKFGGMLKVVSHPHPLKFIWKATLKSSCDLCGKDLNLDVVFECEDCNHCLCRPCAHEMS